MSYRTTFSVINGIKSKQILDYLDTVKYTFKEKFKFNYLPIITLSLNKKDSGIDDLTFLYPIWFEECQNFGINYKSLNNNQYDDSYTYVGQWEIPKLISEKFKVSTFNFEEWEGDYDFELFKNGKTIYDYKSNYHQSVYANWDMNDDKIYVDPSISFAYSNSKIIKIFQSIFKKTEKETLNIILDYILKNKIPKKINIKTKSLNIENQSTFYKDDFQINIVDCFLSSLGIFYEFMIDSHYLVNNYKSLLENKFIELNTNIPSLKKLAKTG